MQRLRERYTVKDMRDAIVGVLGGITFVHASWLWGTGRLPHAVSLTLGYAGLAIILARTQMPRNWLVGCALAYAAVSSSVTLFFTTRSPEAVPFCDGNATNALGPPRDRSLFEGQVDQLRLVDLTITQQQSLGPLDCIVFDLRLRNPGSEVVFVTAATFVVDDVHQFEATCLGGGKGAGEVEISANYQVGVDIGLAPQRIPIDLAQTLEPDTVDRFAITARLTSVLSAFDVALLEARIELAYNENGDTITTPPLLFVSDASALASVTSIAAEDSGRAPEDLSERIQRNAVIARGARDLEGVASTAVTQLLDGVMNPTECV